MEIAKFITELASSAPSPGGGGVAALCGALSAALSSMVCELTSGKKKYAQYQADIERISEKAKSLAADFTALMGEDEEAFLPLSRAYGLPKDAEGREEIIEAALVRAAEVPFRVLRKCRDAAELAAELAEKGSRLVVSDAGVAAAVCEAAAKSAALNVYANTKLMKNRAAADATATETAKMAEETVCLCRRAYDEVEKYLNNII